MTYHGDEAEWGDSLDEIRSHSSPAVCSHRLVGNEIYLRGYRYLYGIAEH